MPARLIRKLEALPWMTPELLSELALPIDAPVEPANLLRTADGRPVPAALDPRYRA
jgi:hypothetical protein